jgi:predicted Fe-Mo cluster-binding NifX family protein
MKRVAITAWNKIVSPVFDSSRCIILFDTDNRSTEIRMGDISIPDKYNMLKDRGIDTLICGAISKDSYTLFKTCCNQILPWIGGSVNEIISDYRNNIDISGKYYLPGCQHRQCRNRGRSSHCKRQTQNKSTTFSDNIGSSKGSI